MERWICSRCFVDEALQSYVDRNSEEDEICDYCGTQPAASFSQVAEYIYECLGREYDDPNEGVGWSSREGGWLGIEPEDTDDLLYELEATENEDVALALREYFEREYFHAQWCSKEFYGASPSEEMIFDWRDFANMVKHHTRYVFFRTGSPEQSSMLDRIAKVIRRIPKLITSVEMEVFRARSDGPDYRLKTATDLGPPPLELAVKENRMSPAGIPLFYGGLDIETAIVEIRDELGDGTCATVGKFSPTRPLRILDLASLPKVPSLFEEEDRPELRHTLYFLIHFAHDISRPIKKDRKQHIEYVPTQVMTEYFRHLFEDESGNRLDGISYRSSIKRGGTSCVLFFENEDCCESSTNASLRQKCELRLKEVVHLNAQQVQKILAESQPFNWDVIDVDL